MIFNYGVYNSRQITFLIDVVQKQDVKKLDNKRSAVLNSILMGERDVSSKRINSSQLK